MAVAWIGSREVTVEQAAQRAAELLVQSRCPVFSLDGDVHGWRAAIALAERVGAAFDQRKGAALAREIALFTDKGGMSVAPGEVRRRADCVVVVGDIPAEHDAFLLSLAESVPDLSGTAKRRFFHLSGEGEKRSRVLGRLKPAALSCGASSAHAVAALRAQLLGRPAAIAVKGFDAFANALETAAYTAFLYSGAALDELAIEMLQGLVADINKTRRASTLLLPSSDDAWGGALASTWMTGFAPRTGFGSGMPEYDPWRFDVQRMIASGEADLHLVVSAQRGAVAELASKPRTIALACTSAPLPRAAVTIAVGEAGVDCEGVRYSSRLGTLVFVGAQKASQRPSVATVVRMIAEAL